MFGQGGMKITGLAGNILQFGKSVDCDVCVPADLGQLGGDNSRGTVIGREGLVQLGCHTADGRTFFHQMDKIPRVGQIQGGLHPGDPTANHHYRSQNFVGHKATSCE
jgi:hypothetical protein